MFKASIICDSKNAETETRLTTFELTYPRCIHSEFMTHRVFSRNSASSRAIPVKKMIDDVLQNPFIPVHWGLNQKGMQAREVADAATREKAKTIWLRARDEAVERAHDLIALNMHKQIINRLLEPWMWITVIASATEYKNFFKLRCHADAEPHMQIIANLMREQYVLGREKTLHVGQWHLPFVNGDEGTIDDCIKKSVARCARGSYLQQHGEYSLCDDVNLHDRMVASGHWSPFEHQAMVGYSIGGNFGNGWRQYRKTFSGESGK